MNSKRNDGSTPSKTITRNNCSMWVRVYILLRVFLNLILRGERIQAKTNLYEKKKKSEISVYSMCAEIKIRYPNPGTLLRNKRFIRLIRVHAKYYFSVYMPATADTSWIRISYANKSHMTCNPFVGKPTKHYLRKQCGLTKLDSSTRLQWILSRICFMHEVLRSVFRR